MTLVSFIPFNFTGGSLSESFSCTAVAFHLGHLSHLI